MSGRLRTMLPPAWLIALAMFPYVVCEAIYAVAILQGFDEELTRSVAGRRFHTSRFMFLMLALGVWAVWRIARFHPLIRPGYHVWLNSMPWQHPQPLPLGPVLPSWEDAVLVAFATAVVFLRHPGFDPLFAPIAHLLTWSITASLLLRATGKTASAFGVWFSAALVVHFLGLTVQGHVSAIPAFAISLAVAALAIDGTQRSLATFQEWQEWKVSWRRDVRRTRLPQQALDIRPEHLGWPVGRLNPTTVPKDLTPPDALAFSLLAGWWCYWLPADDEPRLLFLGWAGAIGVVMRLFRYLDGYRPPLSLWGRIGTGRLIIPGFDRVLLAPLAAVLAAVGIPLAFAAAGWDERVGLSLATTATLLASLGMGPTLAEWQLTGAHRITPGVTHLSGTRAA